VISILTEYGFVEGHDVHELMGLQQITLTPVASNYISDKMIPHLTRANFSYIAKTYLIDPNQWYLEDNMFTDVLNQAQQYFLEHSDTLDMYLLNYVTAKDQMFVSRSSTKLDGLISTQDLVFIANYKQARENPKLILPNSLLTKFHYLYEHYEAYFEKLDLLDLLDSNSREFTDLALWLYSHELFKHLIEGNTTELVKKYLLSTNRVVLQYGLDRSYSSSLAKKYYMLLKD